MNTTRFSYLRKEKSTGNICHSIPAKATRLLLLLVVAFAGFACSKEEAVPGETPAVKEETAKQYDVPFKNVPATSDIAMYEVNLRAFSSAGNINGVRARLDEIQNLGINVIWLMPIYTTGELKSVGSPYAVRNYMQVNPAFGNLEDLRLLVKEAHSRNMAVILDWVANHTAWDHPWIQNPTWYTRDASGNIISPQGMGWTDVADLNFSSQALRKEMIKAMKYWVLEANVDGYRCDHADGVPTDFWKQAIDTLRNIPDRDIIMFAEAGKKELFNAGFDLIFGWDFYNKLKEIYNNNTAASGLTTVHINDYNNVPGGSHILRWIDNHDDNAWEGTPISFFKGQQGALAAFVLAGYMGGVPLIYNGQEVGNPTQLSFFNNSTTKINWSSNPGTLTEYRKLMAFRNSSNAVKRGSVQTYSSNDVAAFKRTDGNEEVVVIVNIRNNTINFQLPSTLASTSWQNALTNESVALSSSVSLAPYSYLILKK
ncbi:alpha-amylase family glycosyl hydrolase [Pontibacter sp. SGAir0037]|uniref:alpha-amylase family glycosyl hydrolase n=1 Tax=Pontibacter sp. SGAir0037 TaxID=2571030 RepID=UPI0010CD0FBA|nr:alpha-amylase family glycosyl hydrolase [Pontibacter sp. SGAir0037]QCR22790.1 alpha-amylase [Pontibacter sp. SGAir0037]